MGAPDLVTVANAFRTGRDDARTGLGLYLVEHPDDPEALALAAYEMQVRAGSQEEHDQGQQYFDRLHNTAADSSSYHSVVTFANIDVDVVEAAQGYGRANRASLQPQTPIGVEMLILADVVASEGQFQVLCTEPGQTPILTITPRRRAIIHLFRREHDQALDAFRQGAAEATEWVAGHVRYPFTSAQASRLALNVWRDCLLGEAMTLVDLGQREESREKARWVSQQYHEVSVRIGD